MVITSWMELFQLTRAPTEQSPLITLANDILILAKLKHEIQDQTKGVGDVSQSTPADLAVII